MLVIANVQLPEYHNRLEKSDLKPPHPPHLILIHGPKKNRLRTSTRADQYVRTSWSSEAGKDAEPSPPFAVTSSHHEQQQQLLLRCCCC